MVCDERIAKRAVRVNPHHSIELPVSRDRCTSISRAAHNSQRCRCCTSHRRVLSKIAGTRFDRTGGNGRVNFPPTPLWVKTRQIDSTCVRDTLPPKFAGGTPTNLPKLSVGYNHKPRSKAGETVRQRRKSAGLNRKACPYPGCGGSLQGQRQVGYQSRWEECGKGC